MSGSGQNRAARRAAGAGGAAKPTRASRYGSTVQRNALAPGLLAAIVMLAGLAFINGTSFVIVEYVAAILALICAWFAFQAKAFWWIPPLVAIAVLWNPVFPFPFHGPVWLIAQLAAGALFAIAGLQIKLRIAER